MSGAGQPGKVPRVSRVGAAGQEEPEHNSLGSAPAVGTDRLSNSPSITELECGRANLNLASQLHDPNATPTPMRSTCELKEVRHGKFWE